MCLHPFAQRFALGPAHHKERVVPPADAHPLFLVPKRHKMRPHLWWKGFQMPSDGLIPNRPPRPFPFARKAAHRPRRAACIRYAKNGSKPPGVGKRQSQTVGCHAPAGKAGIMGQSKAGVLQRLLKRDGIGPRRPFAPRVAALPRFGFRVGDRVVLTVQFLPRPHADRAFFFITDSAVE